MLSIETQERETLKGLHCTNKQKSWTYEENLETSQAEVAKIYSKNNSNFEIGRNTIFELRF